MTSNLKIWVAVVAVAIIALMGLGLPQTTTTIVEKVHETLGGTTNFDDMDVDSLTQGKACTTLTDANGGTYTLTEAEMLATNCFKFAAGGTGQAVIALTFPATSTMTSLIPNSGECREWIYDATALSAATTTTMTAGTGHDIIAYTTNDDVIDGNELSEIRMCRQADGDVFTFVTEMLQAD